MIIVIDNEHMLLFESESDGWLWFKILKESFPKSLVQFIIRRGHPGYYLGATPNFTPNIHLN